MTRPASLGAGAVDVRTRPSFANATCVWAKIGAVVYGVSQEDIDAYGRKHATDYYKWRACLISCRFVLEKGNRHIPVIGGFLHKECHKLFSFKPAS